jgi:protein-S-isoprenylcysteine O-methyltransferase Ste14
MNSQEQMTAGSTPNNIAASLEQKGLNAIVSGASGVAGGALLVLFLDPVWPVAVGVVGVCLASAIVFCFLWARRGDFRA